MFSLRFISIKYIYEVAVPHILHVPEVPEFQDDDQILRDSSILLLLTGIDVQMEWKSHIDMI